MDGNNNCGACRFWKAPGPPPKITSDAAGNFYMEGPFHSPGQCRRYPPRVISAPPPDPDHGDDIIKETVWPETAARDFCGEFQRITEGLPNV